ncbi:NGG1p interacting factor NIF3 [Marinobacter vulgaris]|uniref:NGG1p interacting factor NIF3 n=1 Tax=Marinobacter vulgaris TaxID=1928331 RepID=A0A2V3ZG49_9GAMM|nr:NGG1p interacting factor NIF3 [Marinobacter vulgaris]PXX88735.1 NGG1p interacting factor NIF3 [Marinobacter vulgaris]TSJ66399.1 NGG1p interacting factor NIF3 [Marinobacter vulgaris]
MYKMCYFVPESHLEITKTALFESGAGRVGDYDCCAWQCKGQGQFRPLDGSSPYLGKTGEVEQVEEFRVELVCRDEVIRAAVQALKTSHPYEEPAYEVFRMEDL